MGKYNIKENLVEGDPDHVEHHIGVAQAVNDLDTRVDKKADLDPQTGKVPASQLPNLTPPDYPVAGLGTVGMMRGTWIAPNGPLPSPIVAWTLVIETS